MTPGFLDSVNAPEEKLDSFKQEHFEPVAKKKSPIWILVAIAGVVSVLGAGFWINRTQTVPDFSGWALSDVATWTDDHGIQLVYSGIYSDQAVDTIVTQDTAPETHIKTDGVIQVEVSLGVDPQALIDLPDFTGWTKTQLLTWIQDNQITAYRFEVAQDDSVLPDTYLIHTFDSDVSDGFRRDDSIVFVITQTDAASVFVMPDLSTYSLDEILAWADDQEVSIQTQTAFSDIIAAGKFVAQSPSAESTVDAGSVITITWSSGPAVTIPDFRSMEMAEAKAWASDQGIALTVNTAYSAVSEGALISQSLKAGTQTAVKTAMTVTYSLGTLVPLNGYANSPLTSLETYVKSQNAFGANLSLTVTYQYSSTVAVNRIIAVSDSDTSVLRGSSIQVIVSLGALVKVPDFTTTLSSDYLSTYNAILALAKSANATVRISVVDDPDLLTENMTITQSIAAGTLCSSADFIDLILTY